MSGVDDPAAADRCWVIAGSGDELLVGPSRALPAGDRVRARVDIVPPVSPEELAAPNAEIDVAESGVRRFVVSWHATPDGRTIAANPAGRNQVSWNSAADEFGVTAAPDAHLTDVHIRFVLRHLTTSLLQADLGGRSVHAVTGSLAGDSARVVAVAGPTRSGKTRLMNQLLVARLVERVVDDDCPVLMEDGAVATLVPRRYEAERACTTPLALLILLSDAVTEAREVDAEYAHAFLDRTPAVWPAAWLPSRPGPPLAALPDSVPVLEIPARDTQVCHDVLVGARRLLTS